MSTAQPTPAEAAAQLVGASYDVARELAPFVLSDAETADAKAKVTVHSWQKEDKVVPPALRKVRSEVAEFITNGKDFHWFLLGLQVATELEVPEELPTGETRTGYYGREHKIHRKIGRSDVAAYIAVLKAEEAGEIQWRVENEADEPMNWAEGYGVGKARTRHAHWQQEHDERWADIERYVVEMTPYRMWAIVNDIEEWAVDELRGDLIGLYDGQDDLGARLERLVTKRFDDAMTKWREAR